MGRGQERVIRRLAWGSSLPGSALVAGYLARRERRALERLSGTEGVPRLVPARGWDVVSQSGRQPGPRVVHLREYIEGQPLHRATFLAEDFFDRLDDLVQVLHRAGVCHNDLHKEQNILVQTSGYPALIDFQLASVHTGPTRTLESRKQDDLRHVQKHRRRYTRDGRGPGGAGPDGEQQGLGADLGRTMASSLWRRTGKPLYMLITRRILRTQDGEERRASSGPWPQWGPALGPRTSRSQLD